MSNTTNTASNPWPPIARSYLDMNKIFGKPNVSPDPARPGWSTIDNAWYRDHITGLTLPGYDRGKVWIHKLLAEPLLEAWNKARVADPYYIVTRVGCFSNKYKHKLQPSTLAIHAYAAAVDINAETNQFGATVRVPGGLVTDPRTEFDIPECWVDAFRSVGWFWGGDFHSTKDPMHFQWAVGI